MCFLIRSFLRLLKKDSATALMLLYLSSGRFGRHAWDCRLIRPRQELLSEILRRDRLDSEHAVAPLRAADDAIVVQTDGLSVGQALEKVLAILTAV